MTEAFGSIVGIKDEPEPDGSHMLKVADFGSQPFEILIPPHQLADIVATLQSGMVERAAVTRFPEMTVDNLGLAHRDDVTALMVSTREMGRLVFRISPEALALLRAEIDRALQFLDFQAWYYSRIKGAGRTLSLDSATPHKPFNPLLTKTQAEP